jgi:HK97 family phage major capsid protein
MNPYLAKMKASKSAMEALLAKSKADNDRVFTAEESTQFEAHKKEFDGFKAMADAWNESNSIDATLTEPANNSVPAARIDVVKNEKVFKTLTAQLSAIKNAATSGVVDNRLNIVNAALGQQSGVGKDGGFAIQEDFAGIMMDSAIKDDPFLSLLDSYNVSANSNAVEWVDVDEKGSIEQYIFGGVKPYWAAEASTVDVSKIQLKERKLELQKLMMFFYTTLEMSEDSNTFSEQLMTRAATLAIRRELMNCVVSANGTGVGKPKSILNSGAIVSVAKEAEQVAATVNYKNIVGMYHRALNKNQNVWLVHPDVSEQFEFLEFPVGVGGVPVYLSASSVGQLTSLKGRPIYESDHCSALGTVGDIMFVDPKEYMMIYKGGLRQDASIHVQFLTAQNCFRFIFRANGMPKRETNIKIKNSSKERTPYVTLATRA